MRGKRNRADVDRPYIVASAPPVNLRGVVLLAHGGREVGTAVPSRFAQGLLRLLPLARALSHRGTRDGLQVAQLRYRMVGYNDGAPVDDIRQVVGELRRVHSVPVCLVGHSMGGRAVLQAADAPGVVGVIALAPWCPSTDPVDQLTGRQVVFAHGLDDRRIRPATSREFALRARAASPALCRFEVAHSGHGMIRRAHLWTVLTTSFVLGALGVTAIPDRITAAMALPADQACAVRI
jgi:dienelactone hydrolase